MSVFNSFGQNKGNTEFKFSDSQDKAVFTCNHVLEEGRDILYVTHDSDGDWQFLCGQDNHTEENAKIISLKEVTELDITINELYEMPVGIGVERGKVGQKWIPFKDE